MHLVLVDVYLSTSCSLCAVVLRFMRIFQHRSTNMSLSIVRPVSHHSCCSYCHFTYNHLARLPSLYASPMLNVASPSTTIIATFASSRTASRPRIIPLFATTFRRRHRHTTGIHTTLSEKPTFHPYSRGKTTRQPETSSTGSSFSESPSVPASPLTPIADEFPADVDSRVESLPMLIPPPAGSHSVSSLKVHAALAKDYRVRYLWILRI